MQQLYESQGNQNLLVSKENVARPASSGSPDSPPDSPPMDEIRTVDQRRTPTHGVETNPSNEPAAEESTESSDDNGSLLSHDPDDEDADPEWLA